MAASPGMARTLIEALRDKPVDALVMEGTHFSEDRQPGLTEVQLEDAICMRTSVPRRGWSWRRSHRCMWTGW